MLLISFLMAQFYTVSQHAQCQEPETEAAKWNSAIVDFITYTCVFPTVTCQNSFSLFPVLRCLRMLGTTDLKNSSIIKIAAIHFLLNDKLIHF